MKFKIDGIGYNHKENTDFIVKRPNGSHNYLFLFFATDVFMEIDNHISKVPANSCIIYSPDYPQLYYNDIDGFTNDWFHFTGEDVDSFLKLMKLPLNYPFQVRNYSDIRLFIKTLEIEYIKKDIYWELGVNSIIVSNFINIAREFNHQINYIKNPYKADLFEKFKMARVEILTNYKKDWTVNEMATLVNLSRSRFTVLYNEFFNCSPIEDLIRERIEKAKYLLSTQTMSVSDVAYAVGYDNIYHFSRQFKKHTSISPSKFFL